jgi:hypothetical protein
MKLEFQHVISCSVTPILHGESVLETKREDAKVFLNFSKLNVAQRTITKIVTRNKSNPQLN